MSEETAESGDGQPMAPNASTDVFVSYASQDKAIADAVCEALERAGVVCWIAPRDVSPGVFYADAIVQALNEAPILVLVLTENAVTSPHVLREVERTSAKRHAIVSLRLTTVSLPPALEYFLSASHWLDASASGVGSAMPRLVEAVRRLVTRPAGVRPGQAGDTVKSAAEPFPHPPGTKASHRLSRPVIALSAVIASGLVYVVADKLWLTKIATSERPTAAATPAAAPAAPAIPEKSIAVLPFTDMSEKKDQEFFADGMAEEVIDLLAKVPGLHVPARTSSFYFKGKPTKIPDIARELGVAHILEGSIRRSGNQIRVTAQLVRADTGFHVWSETYDRDLHDVFKVQDDIANAVAQALQIGLMGGPLTRMAGGTENLEAYQLYLRARSTASQNTRPALVARAANLEQAAKLDPNFALAWIELAYTVLEQTDNAILPPKEGYERTRQLALRALQLSPDLAEPHAVLAYVHRTYDWDWVAAEAELRTALGIDPTYPLALQFAGMLAYTRGQPADAVRLLRASLNRDPLNRFTTWNLATALYHTGRYADAEATYRKLIEIEPDFSWAHSYLAKTLLAEGKPAEALAAAQQEPEELNRLDVLPIVLEAAGRKAEADDALEVLSTRYASSEAFFVAMTYAFRNDHDHALQWLDRAYAQKDSSLVEITGEPLFNNLAGDPRYKAFLRKMNLPE